MRDVEIWDTLAVESLTYKTAFECAICLRRVDSIVSGFVKRDEQGNPVNKKSVTQQLEKDSASTGLGG
jgi:hypothetical protein